MVTGHASEVRQILDMLAPLAKAPLGAWFCFGNHDYFGGDPEELRTSLAAIGISDTQKREHVTDSRRGNFVLGGIDDRIMGKPDWDSLLSESWPAAFAHGA